jgi:hypothetical protein
MIFPSIRFINSLSGNSSHGEIMQEMYEKLIGIGLGISLLSGCADLSKRSVAFKESIMDIRSDLEKKLWWAEDEGRIISLEKVNSIYSRKNTLCKQIASNNPYTLVRAKIGATIIGDYCITLNETPQGEYESSYRRM